MNERLTAWMAIATLCFTGCDGAPIGDAPVRSTPAQASTAGLTARRAPEIPPGNVAPPLPTPPQRRMTRTIDKDPDGDGIANQRVVVTEIYDDAGALLQEIREEDFDADGIVDARRVTTFDDMSH